MNVQVFGFTMMGAAVQTDASSVRMTQDQRSKTQAHLDDANICLQTVKLRGSSSRL